MTTTRTKTKSRKQSAKNVYLRTVKCGNRKSCPECHRKLKGESIWTAGEYLSGKWCTFSRFCRHCFMSELHPMLRQLEKREDRPIELVGYSGIKLPDWLALRPCLPHARYLVECAKSGLDFGRHRDFPSALHSAQCRAKTSYLDWPLTVYDTSNGQLLARVTPDAKGNYRVWIDPEYRSS